MLVALSCQTARSLFMLRIPFSRALLLTLFRDGFNSHWLTFTN
jgi:hypothetical protein